MSWIDNVNRLSFPASPQNEINLRLGQDELESKQTEH